MDFFVLLSSTGGVFGSRGQSNYAAAGTYQDAFARYRVSRGQKCISLDLGLMLAVGFAAERQQITESLRSVGYKGIHEIEFHAMLDHFCNPNLPLQEPANTQIVTGIARRQKHWGNLLDVKTDFPGSSSNGPAILDIYECRREERGPPSVI
jgi:hypothetical protein